MLTFPVLRRQSDTMQEHYSRQVRLDCSESTDVARQEFKAEADITTILSKFGVQGATRPPLYEETDYTLDLQQALAAIERARGGYDRLPLEIRKKYPNWQSVILALADEKKRGEIEEGLKPKPSTKEKDNAPRPDAESGGKGDSGKPAQG